jgi:hypothetical protein
MPPGGSLRNRWQLTIIAPCNSDTPAVHMPADTASVERPERKPIVPTSSRIASEADSRFCAKWRSSS